MQQNLLLRWASNLCLPILLLSSNAWADSLSLPAGIPAPSFANSMVEIGQPGNNDDSTGYGGVAYKYRVSSTQITVQDWVDFLNDIGVTGANDLGLGPMTTSHPDCDNPWCYSPFEYSGGSWQAKAFTDNSMNLDASEAANLPIDWRSLNNVARYLNWLATGDMDTGAFTFTNDGGPEGNWPIASFDANYPGPRLPLEDELYKAMYRDSGVSNTYFDYPLGGNSMTLATADVNSGLHNSNVGGALVDVFSNGGALYAQVGQETGNPWSMLDMGGNRHETTLNPSATTTTILRGAASFGTIGDSHKGTRQTLDAGRRYISIGYRVWTGVSSPSGMIRITKQVTGGTDNQNFEFSLDCDGTLYDVSNIQLQDGNTWESDAIPAGTSCTVNETAPTAPVGFTYDPAQYNPSQTVTVVDGSTITVTVTNPMQVGVTYGNLDISKVVTDKPASYATPTYSIDVDCSDNAFDQTVMLQDGQNQTINNIPSGTTCDISEPTQPAAPAGYSYGTPVINPSSVTILSNQTVSVEVTNPLQGDCLINTPTVTTQCYDNGTTDSSDDTFGFNINTSGDFTATYYDIQGDISVFDVPYGVASGAYGNFLISSGDININLVDADDNTCQLNNIGVTAPASCSATPVCQIITNTASVTALNETDADTTSDSDVATLRADCAANPQVDLSVTKVASQNNIDSGDAISYTITVTNQGSEMATEVELTDQLPNGVTYVSNTPSQGTYDPTTGIWRVGDLADQAQATLTINVTAN